MEKSENKFNYSRAPIDKLLYLTFRISFQFTKRKQKILHFFNKEEGSIHSSQKILNTKQKLRERTVISTKVFMINKTKLS